VALDRIEELRLSKGQEHEIAALLALCFDTDFDGRTAFRQRHHVRYLWREGGVLAGHVALTFRHIRQGSRVIPITGLAEVATHPRHRGKGIARRLVEVAIDDSRASTAQFVMLQGSAALYPALGFLPATNMVRHVDMTDATTHGVDRAMARDLMVLPIAGRPWDRVTMVDLLGHLF
jgi:GNAT superfamily N-acetyltransferase